MRYTLDDFADFEEYTRAHRGKTQTVIAGTGVEEEGKVGAGQRNDFLFKRTCSLIAQGYNDAEIEGMISALNESTCDPPVDATELRETVLRARQRYVKGERRWQPKDEEPEDGEAMREPQSLRHLMLTGREFSELEVPIEEPLVQGLAYAGYVTLFVGQPYAGKTTFCLNAARSIAMGSSPWEGHPAPAPGTVLILSPDDAATSLKRTLRTLDLSHPVQRCITSTPWDQRIHVLALHPGIAQKVFDDIKLTNFGLDTLRRTIEDFASAGEPVAMIVLDAYADFLPIGESENANEAATRVMGGLQHIATEYRLAIVVVHHMGKIGHMSVDEIDPISAARGASALAAKARMVSVMSRPSKGSRVREITSRANFTARLPVLSFEVAPEEAEEESVVYFKPVEVMTGRHPGEVMEAGVWYSMRGMIRALFPEEDESTKEPSGFMKRQTRECLDQWVKAGLVDRRRNSQGHYEFATGVKPESEKKEDEGVAAGSDDDGFGGLFA